MAERKHIHTETFSKSPRGLDELAAYLRLNAEPDDADCLVTIPRAKEVLIEQEDLSAAEMAQMIEEKK